MKTIKEERKEYLFKKFIDIGTIFWEYELID